MRFGALVPALALLGCGNTSNNTGSGGDDAFASFVAQRFDKDCRAANAPTPDAIKQLDQICSCMTKQILANVHSGDPDGVVNKKIDEGQQACLKQVYPNG